MKKIIISLLALLAVTAVQANNDYAKYYQNLPVQMPQPTLPTIPDNQVSILDCGGKGDGLTLNTEAFAKAISQLNIPTGVPLVYELDADLRPLHHAYLGDPEAVARSMAAVAAQGKAKQPG